MWKTCNLVMLPSNEKAHFEDLVLTPDTKKLLIFQHQNCTQVAQHLYITSDGIPKTNNWCINDNKDTIYQINGLGDISGWNKIIVTNDKSLKLIFNKYENKENNYNYDYPQLSKQFIEYYIEEYNKGNVITEVDVEYDVNNSIGKVFVSEPDITRGQFLKLKVNPDNTINIKLIKNNWNRKEVIKLCTEAVVYGFEHSSEDNNGSYDDRDNNEDLLNIFVTDFINNNL